MTYETADETAADTTDREDAFSLVLALVDIDRLARAQGHSLVDVIVKAAKDAFGIDVRPADAAQSEEA